MTSKDDAESPGWDAIDQALKPIYGTQEPYHVGTAISYDFGGPDPLPGISVYKSEAGQPHWHYVSYGFTDLFKKGLMSPPDVSGYGFELTFRLARKPAETTAPHWVFGFLQNLARYVFESGSVFDVGHHMDCNGPIALEQETKIRAICFVEDRELSGKRQTPNGAFRFVQVFGITLAELAEIHVWNTVALTDQIRARNPLLVTDLARDDFYGDAALIETINKRSATEPSSTGELMLVEFSTQPLKTGGLQLTLGALGVTSLLRVLPKRLLFDEPLFLLGEQVVVACIPDTKPLTEPLGDDCQALVLDRATVEKLVATVQPKAGTYAISPTLEIVVTRSQIKAARSSKVIDEIG